MRKLAVGLVVLLLGTCSARAVIVEILDDDCDDIAAVHAVYDQKDVAKYRAKLDELQKKLLQLKEGDIIALFGKSRRKPAKTFAMPVAQVGGWGYQGCGMQTRN